MMVDKATFYDFVVRHDDQRFEYEGGYIVQQMTGGTRAHSRIMGQLYTTIAGQLDDSRWVALPERGVETSTSIRFPDVVVEPAGEPEDTISTQVPAMICEILSPSSIARDLTRKPDEYMSLPALQAYLVVSQNEHVALLWLRQADGAFPDAPDQFEGAEAQVAVPQLDLTIALADIYRGIKLPPKAE